MIDLPSPNILTGTLEDKIQTLNDYLYRLKEALEFSIDNISTENLSSTFMAQIEQIQAMIVSAHDSADTAQAMAQKGGITVEDVINSALFINTLDALETLLKAYTDLAESNANKYTDDAETRSNAYADNVGEEVKGYADGVGSTVEGKIPTKVSELTNDANYIKNNVSNLTNYYRKTETYTKTEVNNLLSTIPKFSIDVVQALPTENISDTTIYLVPSGESAEGNIYTEWIHVSGTWELLGSMSSTVDLSDYYTKEETDVLIQEAKTYADGITYEITVNYQTGNLEYTRT